MFSFHATKVYNTIEGGAVAFSDKNLYDKLYNLKNFGIRGEERIVGVGANAKMNEFSAIMGLCNLPRISDNIAARKKNAEYYIKILSDCPKINLPDFKSKKFSYNYAYFPVRFLERDLRNQVYNKLKEEQIYARKYFYPLTSDADCFKNQYRNLELPNAHDIAETILVLPLYPELEKREIVKISNLIKKECAYR